METQKASAAVKGEDERPAGDATVPTTELESQFWICACCTFGKNASGVDVCGICAEPYAIAKDGWPNSSVEVYSPPVALTAATPLTRPSE